MTEIIKGSKFTLTQSEAMIVLACSEPGIDLTVSQLEKLDEVRERAQKLGLGPGDVIDFAILAHGVFPGVVFDLKPSRKI